MDDAFGQPRPTTARRFYKVELLVLALDLVSSVLQAAADTATMAYNCAARHANFVARQDAFHEEAGRAIETLTSGEDERG